MASNRFNRIIENATTDQLAAEYNLIVNKKSNCNRALRNKIVAKVQRLVREGKLTFKTNDDGFIKPGFIFTGKWFKGRIEVIKIVDNDLHVLLNTGGQDWSEVWNYSHTKLGFNNGDYFLTDKHK